MHPSKMRTASGTARCPSGKGEHAMKRSLRRAIKESVDNLPSGICFADSNGVIVLCNRQM